jgi:methyl-accepting chemotaxis protein
LRNDFQQISAASIQQTEIAQSLIDTTDNVKDKAVVSAEVAVQAAGCAQEQQQDFSHFEELMNAVTKEITKAKGQAQQVKQSVTEQSDKINQAFH